IDGVEQPEVLPQSTRHSDGTYSVRLRRLDRTREPESAQRGDRTAEHLRVRVRDPEHTTPMRALGVEDARKEPLSPLIRLPLRPGDHVPDGGDAAVALVPDASDAPPVPDSLLKHELLRGDSHRGEIAAGPLQRFQ